MSTGSVHMSKCLVKLAHASARLPVQPMRWSVALAMLCAAHSSWATAAPGRGGMALTQRGAMAPSPRGDAELDSKAEDVFRGSEWRQLRRQAEGARMDSESDRTLLDRCGESDREPRKPSKSRTACDGCDGCGGCSGCSGLGQGLSGMMSVLTGLLVAVLVGFLLWALIKHFSGRRGEEDEGVDSGDPEGLMPESPPGESPASIYLREALALADAGDYKGALRQLLLGSMSWTERQGLIRFRRGLTNREYLRALRSRPEQLQSMREVVLAFEEVYFGRRPATRERFQKVLPEYRAAFENDDREPGIQDAALQTAS